MAVDLTEYRVTVTDAKSWLISKPGTGKQSYRIVWSPGALLIYGEAESLVLLNSEFDKPQNVMDWLKNCSYEQFKSISQHIELDLIELFFDICKFWIAQKHYR